MHRQARVIVRTQIAGLGKQIVIKAHIDLAGSTVIINYLTAHSTLKQLRFVEDLPRALKATRKGGRIYFIDDCILSGTQTLSTVQDLMGPRKKKKYHTQYCLELTAQEKEALTSKDGIRLCCGM
jgi:hypoxanthine-guanine phosphoribosyltransferase